MPSYLSSKCSNQVWFIYYTLLIYFGTFTRDSGAFVSLAFYATYAIAILAVFLFWKRFLSLLVYELPLFIIVVLGYFSSYWSIAPSVSVRRSIVLAVCTCLGMLIGMKFTYKQIIILLSNVLAIISVLSLLSTVTIPSYAWWTDPNTGMQRLQGVLGHPNHLGSSMALAVVLWLLRTFDETGANRYVSLLFIVLSLLCLELSGSVASIFNMLALTISLISYKLIHKTGRFAVLTILVLLPVFLFLGFVFIYNFVAIVEFFGRDPSLTGRVPLWNQLIQLLFQSSDRLWLGYGLDAFWNPSINDDLREVWLAINWKAPYAHNGFIEIFLSLGLLGFTLFLISFVNNLRRVTNSFGRFGSYSMVLPTVILSYILIANMTEGIIVSGSISWLLYVIASTSISVYYEKLKKLNKYSNSLLS